MNAKTTLVATLAVLAALPLYAAAPEKKGPKHEAAEDAARTVKGGASKGVKACHNDIERLCAGIKPGDGRIGGCLVANKAKLSKACRRFAGHGGDVHFEKALMEIDGYLIGVSTPPAAAAPAKP